MTTAHKSKAPIYDCERVEKIVCPNCGIKFVWEGEARHITLHGEPDELSERDDMCSHCDVPLQVVEHVARTWTTTLRPRTAADGEA